MFHLVEPDKQIVQTFEYEGIPGHHVILETITFEDQDGKTKMTDHMVYQSLADRDGMLQSGMEEGSNESVERFAELLKKVSSSYWHTKSYILQYREDLSYRPGK